MSDEVKISHIKDDLFKKYGFVFNDDDTISNDSWCTGLDIYIGKYDNEEYKLISIFHEIGHYVIGWDFIVKWDFNTLIKEIECWNKGIEIARDNGIFFSDNAIAWGYEKAIGYCGHDERECVDWNNKYGKKITIRGQ
jgi:hypothetical protein